MVWIDNLPVDHRVHDMHHHHAVSFPQTYPGAAQPNSAAQAQPAPGATMAPGAKPNAALASMGKNWLMKNRGPPPFNPPAPAEAAASWANHASLANDKAQSALRDIEKIKVDAFARVNQIAEQAQKVMEKAEMTRQSVANDFNKEAVSVFNNYTVAKDAVLKMLKMAEAQALAAKKAAQIVDDSARYLSKAKGKSLSVGQQVRTKASSFAEVSSFPKKSTATTGKNSSAHHHSKTTGGRSHKAVTKPEPLQPKPMKENDISPILEMIRKYMDNMKQTPDKFKAGPVSGDIRSTAPSATVASQGSDSLAPVADAAKEESAKQSTEQLEAAAKEAEAKALANIGDANHEAQIKAFMARLSMGTLMHDTAAAVSAALKSAKDAGTNVMLKEINAEKEILDLLRQAQQTALDSANEASKAEAIALRAAEFTRHMAAKADFAQNAAGQALAAQMAQAMGYPIAVHGEPSPFPPVEEAFIPPLACVLLGTSAFRRDRLSSYI